MCESDKLHDEINGVDAGTGTAVLEETAVLNSENLVLPTGYELYSNIDSSVSNPTVTIENGKATENEYTVKVIKRNNNNIVIENVIGFNKIHLFLNEKYVLANEILLPDKILDIKGSAEPAFMAGMNITVVEGDERNYKITTKEDLDRYIKIKSY